MWRGLWRGVGVRMNLRWYRVIWLFDLTHATVLLEPIKHANDARAVLWDAMLPYDDVVKYSFSRPTLQPVHVCTVHRQTKVMKLAQPVGIPAPDITMGSSVASCMIKLTNY